MTQRTSTKASNLWNVQEPGDPYDIRRSMIARLPEHSTQPMNEYLEMVCLLQAAEIERLSDYLTELQYKYRQIDRRELDRHSYQVQIKELAQKNLAYHTLKSQNDRLKDFIRRQTIEYEELQKRNLISMNMEALQAKYDGVLNELRISREKNQRLEKELSRLNYEAGEWKAKWQRSEQDRTTARTTFERQLNEKIMIEVRIATQRLQEKNRLLQSEVRQLREYRQNKNHEISILSSQKDQLIRQIRLLEEKNRSRGNIQESLNEKNRQIQRLGLIISQKSTKLEQTLSSLQKMGNDLRILEEKYLISDRQREGLLIRIKEIQKLRVKSQELNKYEERVAMMSMEIERLNSLNSLKVRELNEVNIEIQRLRSDLKIALKNRQQSQADLEIMAAHESRINVLTQELDRITMQLKAKNDQIIKLQQRIVVTDSNASQLSTLAVERGRLEQQLQAARAEFRNYKNITENELNNLRAECNRIKLELEQQIASRSDGEKYRIQSDRLRVELQRIRSEGLTLRRVIEQEKSNNLRISTERNKLIEERIVIVDENKRLGLQLLQLRKDIEELRGFTRQYEEKEETIRKLRLELESTESRNAQIEGSIQSIYKQIERLHSVLATKTNQLMKVTKEYSQLEEKCRFLQSKLNNSGGEKQFFQKELARHKGLLQGLRIEIEGKNNELATEQSKYQLIVKQKDKIISQHIKEKQVLQRSVIELQRELSKRNPYEQDYYRIKEELNSREILIVQLQTTIKEKETAYKDSDGKIKFWQAKVIEWQSRLQEAERAMRLKDQDRSRLDREIVRLNELIAKMGRENDTKYKQRVDILTEQNSGLKKKLEYYEKGRFNQQNLRNQLQRAEDTIKLERSDKQNLRVQIRLLEENIIKQNKELELLRESSKEYQMKIVHIENTNSKILQDKLQERQSLIISLQQEIKDYEDHFGSLVQQDRTSLDKLKDYEKKISVISVELDRLKKVVQEKTKECREKDRIIDELRLRLSQPTSSDNSEKYRIEIANLKTAISELQNINMHICSERDEMFKVSHQLKEQYDDNLAKLEEEERRLRTELQYRIQQCKKFGEEISILRQREQKYLIQIKEFQGLISKKSQDPAIKRRLAELQQQNAVYLRQINELKIENANLHTQISQLQLMISEQNPKQQSGNLRQEISSLTIKINEYVNLLKTKDEDIIIWQNKYSSLYSAYEELYSNYNLTKNQYQITIANVRIYQSKLFKLQEDFSALSDALRAAKIEIEQYKKENYSLKIQSSDESQLFQKNLLLSKEIDRLTEISERMQIELSDTRLRLTDNLSLNKRLEEHLGLFVVLFAEIESLRNRLINSEKQCQEVRRSSLVPLRVDKSRRR